MQFKMTRAVAGAAAFAIAAYAVPAHAQQTDAPPPYAEPATPSDAGSAPGVARISDQEGTVEVARADAGAAFAAALNAPVNAGDYLTTHDDARAEIEFPYGTELRLAPGTQVRFTELDDQGDVTQLAGGTLELRVFEGGAGHPAVQTPGATMTPDGPGRYRIAVTADGDTVLTVREGRADVALGDGSVTQTVAAGSAVVVRGQGSSARLEAASFAAADDFDAWNDGRDARLRAAQNDPNVERGMVGAEDLDQYGHWADDASYGQVWQPNDVPAGWSPYSDGRWVWEPYYGWTWIGFEPWGWAPYHYGRWFYARAGWCWYPGPYAGGPYVYEPAVVGFFSFDLGAAGLGIGFGNIGWVPLGPFEPFHRWWGGRRGFDDVRATLAYGAYDVRRYRNFNVPGGIRAVSRNDFANGNFAGVSRRYPNELRDVTAARGVVPVVPTERNLALDPRRPEPLGPAGTSRFAGLPGLRRPPRTFAQERLAVASSAQRAYPERATEIGGDVRGDGAGRSAIGAETFRPAAGVDRPNTAPSAWDRFESSGRAELPRTYAAPSTYAAPHSYDVLRSYSAPRSYDAPRSYSAPRSYDVPRSYSTPHSYDASRSYSAPRSYDAPRSNSAPRSYSAPHVAEHGSEGRHDRH